MAKIIQVDVTTVDIDAAVSSPGRCPMHRAFARTLGVDVNHTGFGIWAGYHYEDGTLLERYQTRDNYHEETEKFANAFDHNDYDALKPFTFEMRKML